MNLFLKIILFISIAMIIVNLVKVEEVEKLMNGNSSGRVNR